MQPSPEIDAFIARVDGLPSGPGISLGAALQPSLDDEAELRKLFATDRKHTRLTNPHVGLVDVFDAPDSIRITRARVVQGKEDLSAKYVMPIAQDARRKEGTPCMVADLEEFKKNWSIFTEGSLSQLLDWNNVVAAGGSVLACMAPLEDADKTSKRATRKFYHSNAYPTSDIDLFLWGVTPEQAEVKIKTIYEAVRDSVPWDVTCIRTKHTISIHSQYPYRSVQIILRLYQSPAEILAGFDIDAPCCAYDGVRVWANPRAIVAMMRQCNTVDMTRRSPSYEVRLAKYSRRGFEVYVPTLKRDDVDPTIYERSIARMEGLARLLVLEKLTDENMRNAFLEGRRQLRGRPNALSQYSRRNKKYKGDLKGEVILGAEMNDYDVASLHLPYGPGWDARRIEKLVYQTDLGMNSTFNPKNKGRRLHRHPAFFGTIEECLEDCCENCPKPIDKDEKTLQEGEDEHYIRGRIRFIEENPGRQSISGSFNPIDVGEWSEQVYMKPTQQLFAAIAAHNRVTVRKLLSEGIDVNQRDHVGRTSLHVAIFSKAVDIACDLIDAGARISARLVDGRAPLHLAARFDQVVVIQKLLEKNAKNVAEAGKNGDEGQVAVDAQDAAARPSSEDDWSSHDDEDVEMSDADDDDDDDDDDSEEGSYEDDDSRKSVDKNKPKSKKREETKKKEETKKNEESAADTGNIPDDDDGQTDIIMVDAKDWDYDFSALAYAVLFASVATIEALLDGGADFKLVSKSAAQHWTPLSPLALTILRDDQDEACKIAERLIQAGVSSSTADDQMRTFLHIAVFNGRTKLVETLLRCDPHAKAVVNFPALLGQTIVFPIVTAINKKHYALVALLLAHEARLNLNEKDITQALEAAKSNTRKQLTAYGPVKNYVQLACQPLETAIRNHDDLSKLLITLGAPVDVGLRESLSEYSNVRDRRTLREWVDHALISLPVLIERKQNEELVLVDTPMDDSDKRETGWKAFYQNYHDSLSAVEYNSIDEERKEREAKQLKEALQFLRDLKDLLTEIQGLLQTTEAKTWKDVYPTIESEAPLTNPLLELARTMPQPRQAWNNGDNYFYAFIYPGYERYSVPEHLVGAYDDLYEACFSGDNDRIQRLCLPVEGQDAIATPGLSSPLNISVKMVNKSTTWSDPTGYTPLFSAIAGRRWSTAKLILAIATAQYHPSDEVDAIKFNKDKHLDDDSDNESCDSDGSDMTIEQKEVRFIDIATRPSAVQSDIHPRKMLELVVNWRRPTGTNVSIGRMEPAPEAYPLMKAVLDSDLEAFVHIANLYKSLPQELEIGADILEAILLLDLPELLDEYIKRTGAGVDVVGARKDEGLKDRETELHIATNDANKLYLGLNVHGKKRMDLAMKDDPNGFQGGEKLEVPLVWKAARAQAKNVLEYLISERPLAAYKFYAMSHSDAKAIWFRRMLDTSKMPAELDKRLPVWLGWTINSLGESPLTAGIMSKNVEVVKLLAKLTPGLINQALQTKLKFTGINPLLFAMRSQCDDKMIDYLLSRNLSPADRDSSKGWNIYHHLCELNNGRLLEHVLKKLPTNVNQALLEQQSQGRLNTPLHIAVKKGHKEIVKTILAYLSKSKSQFLLARDVDGQTPLHCAAYLSFPNITDQLLSQGLEALFVENGSGSTPSELIATMELTHRLAIYSQNGDTHNYTPAAIPIWASPEAEPGRLTKGDVSKVEEELVAMRQVVSNFGEEEGKGNLKGDIVLKWIEEMEERVRVFKDIQRQEELEKLERKRRKEDGENKDGTSAAMTRLDGIQRTSQLIKDALKGLSTSVTSQRQLVHLLDVQKSVGATLSKVAEDNDTYGRKKNYQVAEGDELEAEEDNDIRARRRSLVFRFIGTEPDVL